MNDDITLRPCPCCGAPAVTGADAEYENSNGDPAVECSVCNVMAWTVEDWNRRAAVEADRQDHFRDATKMVPSDDEIYELAKDTAYSYVESIGETPYFNFRRSHLKKFARALLSRYSGDQPAASAEPKWAYDKIDRFLRVNLGDDDYAEYSAALDALADDYDAAPVAQEPVYQVQYNHEGWRDASASRYEAVGKAMAYSDASRWERRIVYAAPVAAQPPVVAWMDDGSTTRGVGKPAYRVVSAATKAEMPALVAAAYSTPLGVIGAAQAQPDVSLTPDMQRDEKRGAKSGQDREDAERWRYIRRKLCLTGNGDGTCAMHAINLPSVIPGWPDPGKVDEFCDAAIDAAQSKGADHG